MPPNWATAPGLGSPVGIVALEVDLLGHPVGGVADAVLDDLDADVEPLVAVDDVVAGEALDSVAAATAEDDVRGLRGIEHDQLGIAVRIEDRPALGVHNRNADTVRHELVEAVDQRDVLLQQVVGEGVQRRVRTRDGGRTGGLRPRVGGGDTTRKDVVVLPARQAFDEVEAVTQDEASWLSKSGMPRSEFAATVSPLWIAQSKPAMPLLRWMPSAWNMMSSPDSPS